MEIDPPAPAPERRSGVCEQAWLSMRNPWSRTSGGVWHRTGQSR